MKCDRCEADLSKEEPLLWKNSYEEYFITMHCWRCTWSVDIPVDMAVIDLQEFDRDPESTVELVVKLRDDIRLIANYGRIRYDNI